jgi:hypothetical protein
MFHTSRLSWIFSNTEHVHRRGRVLKSLNRLRPHLRTTSYCSTHSKRHVSIQGFAREPGRRSSPTNKSNGGRTLRPLSSDLTGRSSRPFPDQVVYARCRTTGKEETRLVVRSVGSIRGNPWVSCRRVWIAVSRDRVLLLLLLLCIRICSAVCRNLEQNKCLSIVVLLPRWSCWLSLAVTSLDERCCGFRVQDNKTPLLRKRNQPSNDSKKQGCRQIGRLRLRYQSTRSRETRHTAAIAGTLRGVSASPIFLSCMHVPALYALSRL